MTPEHMTPKYSKNAILLTGRAGCGKTTLIRKVLARYTGPSGGFYTREIRKAGVRKGFEIVTLDDRHGILAHIDIRSSERVGKYGVDLTALDEIGVSAIKNAVDSDELVVIDEIGPMELRSSAFRQVVLHALEAKNPILGTVVKRSTRFTDRVKSHPRVSLIEVHPGNRDELADQVLLMLDVGD